MTARGKELHSETKSIEFWPKRAKAMNEAGKMLKGLLGERPIPGADISKSAAKISGSKESGLQPTDYCYNFKNNDPQSNRWNVFLKVGRGLFQYVGPFFDYKEGVSHNQLQSVRPRHRAKSSDQTIDPPTHSTHSKPGPIHDSPERRLRNEALLNKLLSATALPFDKRYATCVPNEPGLYGIQSKDGKFLHVGVSHKAGLRKRIFDQHLNGGGEKAASDLVQKVQDRGMASNRSEAKIWIQENCFIHWIVENDKEARTWAEHHILAELQPVWGR
jgi:hypothetical protein